MKKFSKEEIEVLINTLDFSKINGELLPVIAQDHQSNEVLMLAFANRNAIKKTLETGYAHYYSRSRRKTWKKGEVSGHFQEVEELITDCDNDSILIKVKQFGGACHKGYYSCFYKAYNEGRFINIKERVFDPQKVY